jgi:Sulfatase
VDTTTARLAAGRALPEIAALGRHAKELLLAACLLMAIPDIAERLAGIEGWAGRTIFLALLALLWAALAAAAYGPARWLRWVNGLVCAVSAYYFAVYERVTTQFLTYDAFINLQNSAAFAGDAIAQNQSALLGGITPALLLLAAIVAAPGRRLPLPGWMLGTGPLLGTGLLAGMLFIRGGEGSRGQPASFIPLAYLALAEYESLTGALGPRQPVKMPLAGPRPTGKLVLVVDESIAGQYLDINSPAGVPTPLSRQWPKLAIANFGIAASINNCSVGTNITLRYGGTRKDYRRQIATMPSIWAYARSAGMRTVYIDAQRTGGAMQNLMSAEERAEIGQHVQFDTVPVQQRDMAAADELIHQLARPGPAFIMVNKVGAHFPVHDKFPDSHMHYRPVLPRGHFTNISDTGELLGFGGTPADWQRYRNAYRNTLLWNVGNFFELLLAKADLSQTTLIYTSDHGQDLHERGNPGLYTHCSPAPTREEGAVPLVAIRGDALAGPDWSANLAQNRNRSSHYMIFPTLLGLMGYEPGAVEQAYGRSLLQAANDPGSFNTLFNARLNREPVWLPVDPARLAQPPASDIEAR